MPLLFFIIFGLAVYAELVVIINVGDQIGAGLTLLAMVATAVVGLWLVRLQGFEVYRKMHETMQKGKSPVEEMMHGVLLLMAGVLLIIPGFISDALGALLLIPPLRSVVISFSPWRVFGQFETRTARRGPGGVVIEGEYSSEEPSELDYPALEGDEDKTRRK